MAIQKRFPVSNQDVFPAGCWLVAEVSAVLDFNAPSRADGSKPQQLCKDSGLPLWAVQVLDADPEARRRPRR